MLVKLNEVLDIAEKGGFAVPAFNTYNMETVMGVLEAAEEMRAPVIIQAYSRLFTNREGYFLSPIVKAAAEKATVPIAFHLDHGASKVEVIRALRYGATGIMIDASSQPIEENIAETKSVVDICNSVGIPVEGELGHIGLAKDGVPTEHTKVDEAVRYVEETGVEALAVMVGTAHGRYKQAPELNIKRIEEIHAAVPAKLVLHGGSGVPDEQLVRAIEAGIRKINFGTDLCYSFLDAVFATSREKIAIDVFMTEAIESVKQFAIGKIKLLGAESRI